MKQASEDPIVVVLAGGRGTRFRAGGGDCIKALAPICGKPIIEEVMGIYAAAGLCRFVVAGGYGVEQLRAGLQQIALRHPDWSLACEDTGLDTGSGGRLRALAQRLTPTFMLTWCDGLCDIDPRELLRFHHSEGRALTMTAVHPPPRFGQLELEGNRLRAFHNRGTEGWINGAFFVAERRILAEVESAAESFEAGALTRLTAAGEVSAYRHEGYWRCMDTEVERRAIEAECREGGAPWRSDCL